jgi:RHS repeat-associated protein
VPAGQPVTDTYTFDNRLKTRTRQDGSQVRIAYDADGNKIAETVIPAGGGLGETTYFLVDTMNPTGYAQTLEELRAGSVTKRYLIGLDVIAQTATDAQGTTVTFFGYDGHGSVRYLTDTLGAIVGTRDYDAFGITIDTTGLGSNWLAVRLGYAGEEFVPSLGQYYNRARYLDVERGRFWSQDTWLGYKNDPKSLHKYTYANNSPSNYIDPTGHFGIAPFISVLAWGGLLALEVALPTATISALLLRVFVGTSLSVVINLYLNEYFPRIVEALAAFSVAIHPVNSAASSAIEFLISKINKFVEAAKIGNVLRPVFQAQLGLLVTAYEAYHVAYEFRELIKEIQHQVLDVIANIFHVSYEWDFDPEKLGRDLFYFDADPALWVTFSTRVVEHMRNGDFDTANLYFNALIGDLNKYGPLMIYGELSYP